MYLIMNQDELIVAVEYSETHAKETLAYYNNVFVKKGK
jgi:hypothetical protein